MIWSKFLIFQFNCIVIHDLWYFKYKKIKVSNQDTLLNQRDVIILPPPIKKNQQCLQLVIEVRKLDSAPWNFAGQNRSLIDLSCLKAKWHHFLVSKLTWYSMYLQKHQMVSGTRAGQRPTYEESAKFSRMPKKQIWVKTG